MTDTRQSVSSHSSGDLEKLREDFGSNGMYSMAGIGVAFRGKTFLSPEDRAANIPLRTRWIVVLWVPLIPLGSYRVRMLPTRVTGRGRLSKNFELFSKEPLSIKQVMRVWLVSALAVALLIVLFRFIGEL